MKFNHESNLPIEQASEKQLSDQGERKSARLFLKLEKPISQRALLSKPPQLSFPWIQWIQRKLFYKKDYLNLQPII